MNQDFSKILQFFVLIWLAGCELITNDFNGFQLECGDLKSVPAESIFLRPLINGEQQDPKDLEVYRVSADGLRNQDQIFFTSKGCIGIDSVAKQEIIVLNKPSSENPVGARLELSQLSMQEVSSQLPIFNINLESYANRGFDIWSQCGQLSGEESQNLAFKVFNNVAKDLSLSVFEVYHLRGPAETKVSLNPSGCFEVEKIEGTRIILKDSVGLTHTEFALTKDFYPGNLYPVYLKKALTAEELCVGKGIEWKWENQVCSIKSFVELCESQSFGGDILEAIDFFRDVFQVQSCSDIDKSLLNTRDLSILERKGLKDFRAIQSFSHFETLKLNQNRIKDITPLQNMSQLRELYLQNNRISSLSGLPEKGKLRILGLWNNDIKEISALDQFKEIEELYLHNNQISSISSLANLEKLRLLYLSDNLIQDLSPLRNLPQIEELYIAYNRVKALDALASLYSLKKLTLSFNQITDISPLKHLRNVEVFYLWGNKVEDLSAIANWSKLQTLYISDNRVSSLEFLRNIKSLDLFYAPDNKIEDISLLAQQTKMRYLNLNNNPVSDLSATRELGSLLELKVAGTPIDQAVEVDASKCPLDAKSQVVRDYCAKRVKLRP